MPLQTFDVPWLEGRVRFVNREASRSLVTVECFHRRLAFNFQHSGEPALSPGRWIRIRGVVRMDTSVRADGTLAEKNLKYLHAPADGSDPAGWLFFSMRDADVKLLGPKEVVDSLREAVILMRRHVDSWSHNCRPEVLDQTLEAMETAVRTMAAFRSDVGVAEREPAIVSLDISV